MDIRCMKSRAAEKMKFLSKEEFQYFDVCFTLEENDNKNIVKIKNNNNTHKNKQKKPTSIYVKTFKYLT